MKYTPKSKRTVKSKGVKFYTPTAETPDAIIDDLETIHGRTNFYALVSGGKDSMSMLHYLTERDKLKAVLHIRTNIGIAGTTEWVEDYCQDHGYQIYKVDPQPRFIYAAFVLQYGFPSAGMHRIIMSMLKYKTMRDFALTLDKQHHCLISGVRKFESTRRMGNYPEPISSDGNLWFACPLFYMSTKEIYRYVHENGISITPVHKKLGMSGECMCGSYATRPEKMIIREIDPNLADYIAWLEDGVQRFGTKLAKKYPTWGGGISMSDVDAQATLDEFFKSRPDLQDVTELERGICGEECGAGTLRGLTDYVVANADLTAGDL